MSTQPLTACAARQESPYAGPILTEEHWLTAGDPAEVVAFLGERGSQRRWQLFACHCCWRILPLLVDEASRHAVSVAERRAEGRATDAEAREAEDEAITRALQQQQAEGLSVRFTAAMAAVHALMFPRRAYVNAGRAAGGGEPAERAAQCDLLRELFGNPFRPFAFDPAWRSPIVMAIAAQVYDRESFNELPVLADALEDAGCDDAQLLGHLHSATGHLRGCWALDAVLDKP
ncbi:MAG: hypothetical protein U0797_08305 [Gemmataceae bacterium]